ncbi:MAG TPA: hypothetical protein VKB93_02230 [Thermoanaerobaculia bacterium]|nr:hypothetical protein [Thermoanaerobaculia bacterium]
MGETVNGWTVVRSDIRSDPTESGWIGEVDFAGQATLPGTFQKHFDTDALCFFVDESDRGALPRFSNDVRKPWFCFTNDADVRNVAKEGMHAHIRIDSFLYRYSHTDVVNGTKFVSLSPSPR